MRAGLALVLALGAAGCAGSRASARPEGPEESTPVRALVVPASTERSSVVPLPLRAAHPEPELFTVRHRVARGETMYRISRTYGVTVEDLAAANGIRDPRSLAVGQELLIPTAPPEEPPHGASERASAPGGQGGRASGRGSAPPRPGSPGRPGGSQAGKGSSRPVPETRGMLDWPLRGVLYGRFGKKGKEPHDGIDLAAPAGTPVKTAQEGKVLYAGEQRGYGLIVIVQHPNGLITLYAHNRDLRVKTGQTVRRSQVIATVGESGRTSGPHLHFEVRVDGKPVDPADYLGPLPSS